MIKLNLIIDGNYIINKLAYAFKNERTFLTDFPAALRKDFERAVNLYSFDNVYLLSDSKSSWRKRFYADYKGKRKRDEEIDWNFVFDTYDEFKTEVKTQKKHDLIQIDELEGDDIIAYITKESNKKGYSNFIITNDRDIHQLLEFSLEKNYINMIFNFKMSEEKLYLPKNYEVFFSKLKNTIDIFDLDDNEDFKPFIASLIKKTNVNEISSEESLFCKLVTGDKGDNIKSCYYTVSTDGKERGIGDTGSEKIYKIYKDIHKDIIDFNSDVFVQNLAEVINFDKKINDEVKLNEVKSNIKQNRLLIKLDSNYIPKNIRDKLINEVKIK
jgi:hypothetical protein